MALAANYRLTYSTNANYVLLCNSASQRANIDLKKGGRYTLLEVGRRRIGHTYRLADTRTLTRIRTRQIVYLMRNVMTVKLPLSGLVYSAVDAYSIEVVELGS